MIDSDDVFLLRPAWPGAGDALLTSGRAPPGAAQTPPGAIGITVCPLHEPAGAALCDWGRIALPAALADAGALRQGWFVTEPSANDFPRLPVREGEPVLVGVAVFADVAAHESEPGAHWARRIASMLGPRRLAGPALTHRLVPTPRSALHGALT
jgi:hypothetical protein